MKEELTSQTTTNKPPVLATVMFGTMVRLLVGALVGFDFPGPPEPAAGALSGLAVARP